MPGDTPLKAAISLIEPPPQDPLPVTFKEVLQDELSKIAEARRARGARTSRPTADNLKCRKQELASR